MMVRDYHDVAESFHQVDRRKLDYNFKKTETPQGLHRVPSLYLPYPKHR